MDTKPRFCQPRAYACFAAQLASLDTVGGLRNAAVAIAMHEFPAASLDGVRDSIAGWASRIARRVRGDNPRALVAHAHEALFEEGRFHGNTDDYHNPLNSYLPHVLENREGIPISLCLVYKCVLERLGLKVDGLSVPGHFIVNVHLPLPRPAVEPEHVGDADENAETWPANGAMLVDPFFQGRALSRAEVVSRVAETLGAVPNRARLFTPCTHRDWLARMLRNLVNVLSQVGREADARAMIELYELLPQDADAAKA